MKSNYLELLALAEELGQEGENMVIDRDVRERIKRYAKELDRLFDEIHALDKYLSGDYSRQTYLEELDEIHQD